MQNARLIRAATGPTLTANSWRMEGPPRTLLNSFDPVVADRPEDLVIVCDGTSDGGRRLTREPWNDPATGVMRHADAGYPRVIARARGNGLYSPMLGGGA